MSAPAGVRRPHAAGRQTCFSFCLSGDSENHGEQVSTHGTESPGAVRLCKFMQLGGRFTPGPSPAVMSPQWAGQKHPPRLPSPLRRSAHGPLGRSAPRLSGQPSSHFAQGQTLRSSPERRNRTGEPTTIPAASQFWIEGPPCPAPPQDKAGGGGFWRLHFPPTRWGAAAGSE